MMALAIMTARPNNRSEFLIFLCRDGRQIAGYYNSTGVLYEELLNFFRGDAAATSGNGVSGTKAFNQSQNIFVECIH